MIPSFILFVSGLVLVQLLSLLDKISNPLRMLLLFLNHLVSSVVRPSIDQIISVHTSKVFLDLVSCIQNPLVSYPLHGLQNNHALCVNVPIIRNIAKD